MYGLRCSCKRFGSSTKSSLGEECSCESSSLKSNRRRKFSFIAVREA